MLKVVNPSNRLKVIVVSLAIMFPFLGCSAQPDEDISIGKSIKIFSEILNEERKISVHLPDGYDKSKQSYPVLYILDSEWETHFFHTVSTADYLGEFGHAPKMISVGICNTIRNRDMIPKAIEKRPNSGGSDKFLHFINEELKPYINKNYRTEPFNLIFGGSNAGLFVVYALLSSPGTFDAYIAGSPMIGHCPDFMNEKAESFINKSDASSKFLYMIYGENDFPVVIKFVPDFYNFLDSNTPGNHAISMKILEGEGHVPYSSLYDGLRFTFSGWPFPEDQRQEAGLDDIRKHYSRISNKFGFKALIPLDILLDVGIRKMMDKKDNNAALEALNLACRLYPYSPDAFYYLGLAHENNDELELALKNYKKALQINLEYHMATDKIKTLEKKN